MFWISASKTFLEYQINFPRMGVDRNYLKVFGEIIVVLKTLKGFLDNSTKYFFRIVKMCCKQSKFLNNVAVNNFLSPVCMMFLFWYRQSYSISSHRLQSIVHDHSLIVTQLSFCDLLLFKCLWHSKSQEVHSIDSHVIQVHLI